jgi:hypothetical protein
MTLGRHEQQLMPAFLFAFGGASDVVDDAGGR